MSQPVGPLAKLVDILDILPCGAVLINPAGQIVHVNTQFSDMARRAPAEVIGRDARFLDAPGDRPVEPGATNSGNQQTPHAVESYLPLPDGERLPVMVSSAPVCCVETGAVYRLITLLDVSPLKTAAERVREQYREVTRLSDTVLAEALGLDEHARELEHRVRQRTRELHTANRAAIRMLAVASEVHDLDTGAHVQRIQTYSETLARELGLPASEVERIGYSAVLHDVGKIQVPDRILKKPGPLTPDERREMEAHTLSGERILAGPPFFDTARQIARSHHENWDGSGYPDRLRGAAIPLAARIVHLADVFDALSTQRVYKPPWPRAQAIRAVRAGRGTLFDPQLVQAFEALVETGRWSDAVTDAA